MKGFVIFTRNLNNKKVVLNVSQITAIYEEENGVYVHYSENRLSLFVKYPNCFLVKETLDEILLAIAAAQ